jgi:cell division septation protein DedD
VPPATAGAPASATPSPAATPATPPAADPPKPTPNPTTTPKPEAADGDWFVQVNSFGTRANADKELAGLKSKNVAAASVFVAAGKTPYHVRVGPFDRAAAEAMKVHLVKLGYTPRVTR